MTLLKIEPKIMRNICISAHPQGCRKLVQSQIDYVKAKGKRQGPRNVLIIGGSAGYGLATRIVSAYAYGSRTINVSFETPAVPEKRRTASVGWYNTHAFEDIAEGDGLWCQSIFGDAFSEEIKVKTIETIKEELGTVDLVVYSIASGRRVDPKNRIMYTSVLKPIDEQYFSRSLDIITKEVTKVSINPASEYEIASTIKVMGGEDWKLWISALAKENVLEENFITLAYSYIGPELTRPLYRNGTIGKAKEDLELTAYSIDNYLQRKGIGRAYVSINKALVTRASMVIPVVPLYLSILYKVMKKKGIHETCIEQMYRMCTEKIYGRLSVLTDNEQRIRLDDWEMRNDVQIEVEKIWDTINSENILKYSDVEGFRKEFYNLHGFMWDGIDYNKAVEI